jgi:predicted pyridoxine 5'-phosphate oxidase superfamily flavin-nucleotide-binding protein
MDQYIIDQIINADARALATTGPHEVNVVPVSVVKVIDGVIYLYNFFMKKTAENILTEPYVALTCWKGLEGIQVKATAAYATEGEVFTAAASEMKERFPDRTLSGVIILTPRRIYDISADRVRAGKMLM